MDYILGLDLGATSLGWSVVELGDDDVPLRLERMGVRIFSDGRDSKTKEPLAVARRTARGMRKRRDRYVMRRETLMNKLIKYGLMPESEAERKALERLNPYELRVKGLDEKLLPYELGRALFHINQRRGFKSNRKADRKNDEAGAMKEAIGRLTKAMTASGARTLGEYLYGLNKGRESTQDFTPVRVRTHLEKSKIAYSMYPTREMYEDEVRQIFLKQDLSDEIKADLFKTIFNQRPLKTPQKGHCPFEKSEERCYIAFPAFQRFRALQQINQLRVRDDFTEVELNDEQKRELRHWLLDDFSKLDKNYRLTFAAVRKILGSQYKNVKFNLESERRKGLDADKTTALLRPLFGTVWADKQDEIVDLLLNTESEDDIKTALLKYGLSDDQIKQVLDANLPDGTGSLSLKAINKINPFLEQGLLYDKAVVAAGYVFSKKFDKLPEKYESFINPEDGEIFNELPYYGQALPERVIGGTGKDEDKKDDAKYYGKINNPTVHIALNQVRQLVNALVKKYGHPNSIVVELARDLKLSRDEKKRVEKEQAQNEAENKKIGDELTRRGIKNNYDNRMKYKLWKDSAENPMQRCCPFCGKPIPKEEEAMSAEFEIEHLLPFSRSYLDARSNKVLSCRRCNREKGNRSPWEAFHNDAERWNEILARVENLPENKRWKFNEDAFKKLQDEKGDVLARMLTDTQYMSRIARQYLCFAANPRFVYGIPGQLTSKLRDHWGLNSILSEQKEKDRTDHRHHAIDAFVVACTGRGTLQKYATERRDFGEMPQEKAPHIPFPTFRLSEIKDAFDKIVISHKPDHGNPQKAIRDGKTVAKLHEETYYGMAGEGDKKGTVRLTKRVPCLAFTKSFNPQKKPYKLDDIVDQSGTANKIRERLENSNPADYEKIVMEYFNERKMKHVKVFEDRNKDVVLAFNDRRTHKPYRYAIYGGNAYAEIYCSDSERKNAGKWQIEIIPNYCAHQKNFVPNWRHTDAHAKLIMRLHIDDMVAYEKDGETIIARVKKMSGGRIYFRENKIAKEEADKLSWGAYPSGMQERNLRKITVTVDGVVLDPKRPKGGADG